MPASSSLTNSPASSSRAWSPPRRKNSRYAWKSSIRTGSIRCAPPITILSALSTSAATAKSSSSRSPHAFSKSRSARQGRITEAASASGKNHQALARSAGRPARAPGGLPQMFPIDHQVQPAELKGGHPAAQAQLKNFLKHKFPSSQRRTQCAELHATSNLFALSSFRPHLQPRSFRLDHSIRKNGSPKNWRCVPTAPVFAGGT